MYALESALFDKLDQNIERVEQRLQQAKRLVGVTRGKRAGVHPEPPDEEAAVPDQAPGIAPPPAVPQADGGPPAAAKEAPPKKKKKTQAERMAELSTPRFRDERIKPGMHVYKPPVRGLAYRGTEKMEMYKNTHAGGMEYKHLDKNVKGDLNLKNRETRGYEKVELTEGAQGLKKQREIETKVAKQRAVEKSGGQLAVGATASGVQGVKASRSRSSK